MLKNYLIITLRNIYKQKFYSFINIFGLSFGLTCFILISLYIKDELSYDTFHTNYKNIYRVSTYINLNNEDASMASAPVDLGKELKNEVPSIIDFVRIIPFGETILEIDGKKNKEENILLCDESIFNVFSFTLINGETSTALSEPFSIVLTKSSALKYFNTTNCIGEEIFIRSEKENYQLKVTGVVHDVPLQSHFNFDFLISLKIKKELGFREFDHWGNPNYHTYILLNEDHKLSDINQGFKSLTDKFVLPLFATAGLPWDNQYKFELIPLSDIHLHSRYKFEMKPQGKITNIYIFATIGIFILVVACINYVNLAISCSLTRSKEVGVRKVFGAFRKNLVFQYLTESIFFSILALICALTFSELLLPKFNLILDKTYSFSQLIDFHFLLFLLFITIFVGFLSGIYPAFYLSSIPPIDALKGGLKKQNKKNYLRNALVVFQFIISIALIACVFIGKDQIIYLKNKNLGFDVEQIMVIFIREEKITSKYELLKEQFLTQNDIINVCASVGVPGAVSRYSTVKIPKQLDNADIPATHMCWVDRDFFDVYGIELINGKLFSQDNSVTSDTIILNETATKIFNFDNPINEKIIIYDINNKNKVVDKYYNIIGLIKDFHFQSLHRSIEPMTFFKRNPNSLNAISIKLKTSNLNETIEFIKNKYDELQPIYPFYYIFIDDQFAEFYTSEENFLRIVELFSLIAILIACLGLFALTAYMINQKTKEIGIRKVFGATNFDIIRLCCREFFVLIVLANIIALPLGYIAMSHWLENFAYRIAMDCQPFILASFIIVAIALLTITTVSLNAAKKKPVETLRYE